MTRRRDLAPEMQPHHPIPADGAWWNSPAWDTVVARVGNHGDGIRAMAALRAAFPANEALEMELTHPFVRGTVMYAGALGLLELGLRLADLPVRPSVRKRLRHPDQFHGAEFEVWAGHLFQRLGATVAHEPIGEGVAGPDWFAGWQGSTIAVEAKRPEWSHDLRALTHAANEFSFAFMRALPTNPGPRMEIRLDPDAELYDSFIDAVKGVDLATIRRVAAGIAKEAGALVVRGVRDATPLSGGHTVSAKEIGGVGGFQTSITGPQSDAERELVRVRRTLREAVSQAASTGRPVVVAVDATNEFGVGLRTWAAAEVVRQAKDPWLKDLCAVVVRSGLALPEEPRPYTFLTYAYPVDSYAKCAKMTCDVGHHTLNGGVTS